MQFLADENIKKELLTFLSERGHDARYADKGFKNSVLINCAKREGRVLLTHDTDFLNTAMFPPERYDGIIVLRIHPPVLEELKQAMISLCAQFDQDACRGRLFIVKNEGIEMVKNITYNALST